MENGIELVSDLYPNPATGTICLELKYDAQVRITDPLGKVNFSNNLDAGRRTIDLSLFRPGVYVVQIYTGNQYTYRKIVVKK
jgi:hypothetical protein